DIFLEFRTIKAVRAKAGRQDRELRERIADSHRMAVGAGSAAKRQRPLDEARTERANQGGELIQRENHLNFIKMHYLNHYVQDVRRFGVFQCIRQILASWLIKNRSKKATEGQIKMMPPDRSWHNIPSSML